MRAAGVVVLAAAGALALPGVAGAVTITVENNALVYRAEAGETLATSLGFDPDTGRVTFSDILPPTSMPAICTPESDHVACLQLPGGVRIIGGPGKDSIIVYDAGYGGFPANYPFPLVYEGGAGNDLVAGGSANETMYGGDGVDTLVGGGGSDVLYGGAGSDMLRGDGHMNGNTNNDGGSDRLYGEDGDDTLTGDSVNTDAQMGTDVLDGGNGTDTVEDDWYRYDTGIGNQDPSPTITLDGVANDGRPGENDQVVNIERIQLSLPADSTQPGTVVGSAGADEINVTSASGIVRALDGNDVITGSDRADNLDGGAGDDKISGGFGDDVITGGPGRDDLSGDRTAACFYGPIFGSCTIGTGNDTIHAQDGEVDVITCGPGVDTVYADAVDQVNIDCENVVRSGASTPPPGPGTSPPPSNPTPVLAPAAKLTVPATQRLRTIARSRALRVRCALNAAGTCRVTATIARRDALRLKLKLTSKRAKTFTLAVKAGAATRTKPRMLTLRLPARTARTLTRVRTLRVTFTVRVTAPGTAPRTQRIVRTLRR